MESAGGAGRTGVGVGFGVAFALAFSFAGGGAGGGAGGPSLLEAGAASSDGLATPSKDGLKLRDVKSRSLRPGGADGGGGPSGGGILEVMNPSGVLNSVVSSRNPLGEARTKGLMEYHDG